MTLSLDCINCGQAASEIVRQQVTATILDGGLGLVGTPVIEVNMPYCQDCRFKSSINVEIVRCDTT